MVQSVSVVVPGVRQAAAPVAAELPLMVQSVSVVVPPSLNMPPPELVASLPLTVQLVSVAVPSVAERRHPVRRSCR